ncbi:MAG: hypothetical protein F4Y63_07280 [Chloroflexi bacterium]|nr:hypothetical protein [Chloroflexota bacterium]
MIPLIQNHTDDIAEICRRHHVKRLEVFGSAAVGDFNPQTSDIDFLVDFDEAVAGRRFQTRLELTDALQTLFGRHVDLVVYKNVVNPYFRRSVDATKEPIYEA